MSAKYFDICQHDLEIQLQNSPCDNNSQIYLKLRKYCSANNNVHTILAQFISSGECTCKKKSKNNLKERSISKQKEKRICYINEKNPNEQTKAELFYFL